MFRTEMSARGSSFSGHHDYPDRAQNAFGPAEEYTASPQLKNLADIPAGLSTLPLAAISSTLTALEANKNGDNLGPQGAQALDKAGYESVSPRLLVDTAVRSRCCALWGRPGDLPVRKAGLTGRRTAARRYTSTSPTMARPRHGTGSSTSLPSVRETSPLLDLTALT